MLNQIELIFDDMRPMLKKLKKDSYEVRMESFLQEQGHYIDEMISYLEDSSEPAVAAAEIADIFANKVRDKYVKKKKRVPGNIQVDLDFFMIYYVFPAILKTDHEYADVLCKSLCGKWNEIFKSAIKFTDYDTIYNGFRDKLFGFIPI